jgi:hypothetical protein
MEKSSTTRVPIPVAVRREVLIEASYRCAMPRCMTAIAIDVHHIDENPSNNDPSNLIALCPTCHSAFHRKTYSVEAIRFWKLMLQQLNAAYDRNAINLLLMLATLEEAGFQRFEVTGDGFLAFSPLLSGGLIKVNIGYRVDLGSLVTPPRHAARDIPYYEVTLSESGRATMKAWKEGNPAALPQHFEVGL